MPVTIEDISKHLGVSVSTVSKALNDYTDVSPETKQRVLDTAQQLGYHPSAAARSLRRQRTEKIGFLYNYPSTVIGEFASRIINGAVMAAEIQGYNIILYPQREDQQDQLTRICRAREVDGLLVMGSAEMEQIASQLFEESMPMVIMNRRVHDRRVSFVTSDQTDAGYQATRRLIDEGRSRIAFVTRQELGSVNDDRLAGYRRALAEAGIPFDRDLVRETPMQQGSAHKAMADLLMMPNPPTAIMAINDYAAVECLKAVLDRGYRVPTDVSVIGSDNVRVSLTSMPPLTTLHPPLADVGRQATEALLEQVQDPDASPCRELLPVRLVERQSTLARESH